MTASHAALS
jgi:non-homologous end joining protein Ku